MKALVLFALLALGCTAASAMEKGDEAPNFKFEHSWNTLPGAKQLTDYRGKIVFLEIWKIHWEPCIRFMPHLVEVNEKYRDKGIEILMATDVDQAPALEKFIAEKNLHVGVVRVPDVYKLVKASGYPTSYGIDVDGKCIWRGHPQGLNDNLVEGWLKDMRAPKLPRKLSDELARAAADYESQKYGKALEGAQKLLKHKTEQIRADAQYLYDIVAGRLAMNQEAAKIHREAGFLDKLLPLLEQDAEQFEDNDWAKDCAKEAKKLKGSKDYKKCVDARDELAKVKPELEKMKPKDAKKALEKIAKDFKGTPYADEAAKLAEAVKE